MKQLVAIGGGTGLFTLLTGLKKYPVHVTSVVSMMDDGGSTGRLRDEFGVLPPGDIRRSLAALSQETPRLKELFQYRFDRGNGLNGHSFGNLFLTALREVTGSDAAAIEEAGKILKIKGRVLPVTLQSAHLVATLQNGTIIRGQAKIAFPTHDPELKILKLEVIPAARTTPEVRAALAQANTIVIGPGDLFTSILANLEIGGVVGAIRRSKAKKIYVVNLMTKLGETGGFSVKDHIQWIIKVLGKGVLDVALYNTKKPPERLARAYRKEGAELVTLREGEAQWCKEQGVALVGAPMLNLPSLARHNSARLARYVLAS